MADAKHKATTQPVLKPVRAGAVRTPFEDVRLHMASAGWWPGENGAVIAFASRKKGEGVTTMTAGVGRAVSEVQSLRVLTILQTPGDEDETSRPDAASADITPGVGAEPDRLYASAALQSAPEETAAWSARLNELRAAYDVIFIDAGSCATSAPLFWRDLSDRIALVVDGSAARQEVIEHFRRELDRSRLVFDGFVTNRRKYPIPNFVYRLMS